MRNLVSCVFALSVLAGIAAESKEASGRWTDESIMEYSTDFLDRLRDRFLRRAELVKEEGGTALTFETPTMVAVLGDPGSRKWKQWEQKDLSQRYGEKALEAYAKDLEGFRQKVAAAKPR